MRAYEAAMAGQAPPIEVGASRSIPGTIAALTVAYFNSHEFQTLADSTKATYRNIIQRIRNEHGDKRVALVQREHIVAMLNKRVSTPAAANNWLRMVRMLMRFAITEGLRKDDPTLTVKSVRKTSEDTSPGLMRRSPAFGSTTSLERGLAWQWRCYTRPRCDAATWCAPVDRTSAMASYLSSRRRRRCGLRSRFYRRRRQQSTQFRTTT